MKQQEFTKAFERLTRNQREVLQHFLLGKSDLEIGKLTQTSSGNATKHIQRICHHFGLKNQPGEHYPLREKLLDLFRLYKPELLAVTPEQLNTDPPFPGGSLALNSFFYIKRSPVEEECYREIVKPGALVLVKAPRLMGKTSLLNRIQAEATTKLGYIPVNISLLEATKEVLGNLEKFLQWFCVNLGKQLGLKNEMDKYWEDLFGEKTNCSNYLEKYLLYEVSEPIILVLDELDRIFPCAHVANDFLGLLRSWHEKAKNDQLWRKLRLLIAYSTDYFVELNVANSPFNVGFSKELIEFGTEEIQQLSDSYQLNWSKEQIKKLEDMVGGHPYLVQLAMYNVYHQKQSLEDLLATADQNSGIYSSYLRHTLLNLLKDIELAKAFEGIVETNTCEELSITNYHKLYVMGLVKGDKNKVTLRCNLYQKYFSRVLPLEIASKE